MDSSAPLLAVDGLRVAFGGRAAVQGLSFSLRAGQTLGLVGESGSGKSATSLALMRLLPPSAQASGEVRLTEAGEPVRSLLSLPENAMRRLRGRHMAMIFQEPMTALNPVMRVGRQIGEAWQAHHPRTPRAELEDRVLAALREVALPDPASRLRDFPHQFSGGQRQRLLIAMALIHRPALLIADEPTTALDVTVQAQILELLAELRRSHGLAMLFISHDLAVVAQACGAPGDQVAVMRYGELVEQAPAAELFRAPRHPYTQRLLASAPTMRTDRSLPLAGV